MKAKDSCKRIFYKGSGNGKQTTLAFGTDPCVWVYAGLEYFPIREALLLHDLETKKIHMSIRTKCYIKKKDNLHIIKYRNLKCTT